MKHNRQFTYVAGRTKVYCDCGWQSPKLTDRAAIESHSSHVREAKQAEREAAKDS
jgi:hypothetical protein